MKIGYMVMSVDDSRQSTKATLHRQMREYDNLSDKVDFVDGREHGVIEEYISKNNIKVGDGNFHWGELGVWFSSINAWKAIVASECDAVIVFEDDAAVLPLFHPMLDKIKEELPDDFDFMSLFVPPDQTYDYYYRRRFFPGGGWELTSNTHYALKESPNYIGSKYVSKAYQGYSNVAIMYSKQGAQKILDMVDEFGVNAPVDCFIFAEHLMGHLNGYSLMPVAKQIVTFVEHGTIARATGMFN